MADTMNAPRAGGNDVEQNKLWAVIAYLGVLCLIPLLAKRDSAYAQYHAKQGLVLFVAGILLGFVSWIPVIGWLVGMVGWIAVLVLMLLGIMNALGGKTTPLPVIGQYADQFKL